MKRWVRFVLFAALWLPGCGDDGAGGNNQNNNTIDPSLCGNGTLDGLEECDDGVGNSDTDPDACRTDCLAAHCGDGVVDTGEPCDDGPANHDAVPDACRADCEPPVCGDLVVDIGQGELCDDGNTTEGDGCNADCVPEICGNNYVEPNEACDDGNFEAGDGCSANCTSNETCGNAIVDYVVGETCDDGNAASHDGCGSSCTAEIPVWLQWSHGWRNRREHAAAYYTSRGALVLFGGLAGGAIANDTWAHDGNRWYRVTPWVSPPARRGHTLVYDPIRDRLVLFGGEGAAGTLNDTWEFNGWTWEQLSTATAPPARFGHGMTYDTHRRRMVVFGGLDGLNGTRLGDTWELDGDTWTQRATNDSPPALDGVSLIYDPVRRVTVLFGGQSGTHPDDLSNATWELDNTNWIERAPAQSPEARRNAAAAYGAMPHQGSVLTAGVIVHGGLTADGTNYDLARDAWVFIGSTWIKYSPQLFRPLPTRRYGHTLSYVPSFGEYSLLALVGGYSGLLNSPGDNIASAAETWLFGDLPGESNDDWLKLEEDVLPPEREAASMAWDSGRRRMVLYGGSYYYITNRYAMSDTWEFDGLQWIHHPASSAGQRADAAMAYHAQREQMLLFGGQELPSGSLLGDTFTYDGASWTELPGDINDPTPRHGHAMAYDPNAETVVLFGGFDGARLGGTWVWDGGWSEINTANAPLPRFGHQMVWNEDRQRIVLFGGSPAANTYTNVTWEFDGVDWVQLSPTQSPPGRTHHGMAYHALRKRDVIFGGTAGSHRQDTWEYASDNGFWSGVLTTEVPSARRKPAVAYNPEMRSVMLFGGSDTSFFFPIRGDTWFYGYDSTQPEELCANGTDDDADGLADCGDPDCDDRPCGDSGGRCEAGVCACWGGTTESNCADYLDDDCDGLTDCADADCAGAPGCEATELSCFDAFDNDGDGLLDCGDPDCQADPACDQALCADWVPIYCNAWAPSSTLSTPSLIDSYGCDAAAYPGSEAAFKFVAPWTGTFDASMVQPTAAVRLAAIASDGVGACDPTGQCLDMTGDATPNDWVQVNFSATAGQTIFLVVDGPLLSVAGFAVRVGCSPP